jgi:hypothetical protein
MHPGVRRGHFAANHDAKYTRMPLSIGYTYANERRHKLEDFERISDGDCPAQA